MFLNHQAVRAIVLVAAWLLSAQAPAQDAGSLKPGDDQTAAAVAQRNRDWKSAQSFAAKQNWGQAIRVGRQALAVHDRFIRDEPRELDAMLDALAFWHSKQREFPESGELAKRVEKLRSEHLGATHWRSVNARLDIALYARLSQLTDDEWQQFIEADGLRAETVALASAGRHADALEKALQTLPVYERLLGREHPTALSCVMVVAACHLELGQYFEALPLVKGLAGPMLKLKGPVHPDSVNCLKLLARFNEAIGDLATAEEACRRILEIQPHLNGPQHAETIAAEVEVGRVCVVRKKYDEAERLLATALKKQRDLLGDEHVATAQTMKVLGTCYCEQGKADDAERLLPGCVTLFEKLTGERSLATASAYNALGKWRLLAGEMRQAEKDLKRSLEICEERLGKSHPTLLKVLENLAGMYDLASLPGAARQIRLRSLEIADKSFGPMNVVAGEAAENLANTYLAMNDFALAHPLLLRAQLIRNRELGEEHPQTAAVVAQLAYVYQGVNEPHRAEPLYREALAVFDKHPFSVEAAQIRKRLGSLYLNQGQIEQAETEFRAALNGFENHSGTDHRVALQIKTALAVAAIHHGDFQAAVQWMSDVVGKMERTLQPNDAAWIEVLEVAGIASLGAGNPQQAERLLNRSLAVAARWLELSAAFESERQRLQQMMLLRNALDLYLSLPPSVNRSPETLYETVLSWKGGTAQRQWRDRQEATPETDQLTADLQAACRKLGTLTLRVPEPAQRVGWVHEIFELNMRKEKLEQERASLLSWRRRRLDLPASTPDIQRSLPPGTALVDFVQYSRTSFEPDKQAEGALRRVMREHYVGFVLRRDRIVLQIDFGDVGPINDAVLKWRKSRGYRPDAGQTDWAAEVGRLLWEPLRPYVDKCDTILISPDGILSQLAWNMLPGSKPGSYLIEDHAIGIVPESQMIPLLPARRRGEPATAASESLLLVGNVDYSAPATSDSRPTETNGGRFQFNPLRGTSAEVQSLRSHFQRRFPAGNVTLLDRSQATEGAFWREAPQHRWLHIATHGFFSPPSIKTALATQHRVDPRMEEHSGISLFHVGFLNGLALTGANVGAAGEGDDGILTALELSTMDLRHIEIAVLSGCETGLGQIQPGEGSFGMQRALQIAGVGATVGSLWTVSDEKTNLLMQRFYTNLWDKQLPKLEALRQAQLWLLNSANGAGTSATADGSKRLSPHYWAPFVLSGDWR